MGNHRRSSDSGFKAKLIFAAFIAAAIILGYYVFSRGV